MIGVASKGQCQPEIGAWTIRHAALCLHYQMEDPSQWGKLCPESGRRGPRGPRPPTPPDVLAYPAVSSVVSARQASRRHARARSQLNAADACDSSRAAGPVPPSPLAPGRTNSLVPCCHSTSIENHWLLPATEDSALPRLRVLWPLLTSLCPSRPVARPVVRFTRTGSEISQGKSCHLPSAPAGFTLLRVRMTTGRPRPSPGCPTKLAFYPVSVRRVRVLPLGFLQIPPRDGHPCPRLAVPVIAARRRLPPPGYMTCLAHDVARGSHR